MPKSKSTPSPAQKSPHEATAEPAPELAEKTHSKSSEPTNTDPVLARSKSEVSREQGTAATSFRENPDLQHRSIPSIESKARLRSRGGAGTGTSGETAAIANTHGGESAERISKKNRSRSQEDAGTEKLSGADALTADTSTEHTSRKEGGSSPVDLAIIGSGPAALTAAIYARRAGLSVRIYERAVIGGTLNEIAELENFPGFEGPGAGLAETMRRQAERYGAEIIYGDCTEVRRPAHGCELLVDGEWVVARALLVASGAAPRRLDLSKFGEAPHAAPPSALPPVSYCALCDGALARGESVAVIGGANSAAHEALYLADLAREVTIITHSELKSDAYLADRVRRSPNIALREHTEVTPALLAGFDRVFVAIGKRSASDFLRSLNDELLDSDLLDEAGYVITAASPRPAKPSPNLPETPQTPSNSAEQHSPSPQAFAEYPHQTIIPGLFAAGDVRLGAVQQAVTAAAEGAAAAIEIADYLKSADAALSPAAN